MDPDQTAPIGAVCSGSTLFASILNSSVMLGRRLRQTTVSNAFFSWRFNGKDYVSHALNSHALASAETEAKWHHVIARRLPCCKWPAPRRS